MSLDERRAERRARIEAAMFPSEPDPVAQLGYDPDQYELVADDEPEQEWADDEVYVADEEPEPVEQPTADEIAATTMADFDRHLNDLEQEIAHSGHRLTTRERRQIAMDSLDRGGLTPETTSNLFYRTIANKIAAKETEYDERRNSKDPNVRRRARREAMVHEIDNGGLGI